jgi:hypothetical protein
MDGIDCASGDRPIGKRTMGSSTELRNGIYCESYGDTLRKTTRNSSRSLGGTRQQLAKSSLYDTAVASTAVFALLDHMKILLNALTARKHATGPMESHANLLIIFLS